MTEPRRIKITHVHPEDAFSEPLSAINVIGMTGTFELASFRHYPGYYTGHFYPDSQGKDVRWFFAGIRYRRI